MLLHLVHRVSIFIHLKGTCLLKTCLSRNAYLSPTGKRDQNQNLKSRICLRMPFWRCFQFRILLSSVVISVLVGNWILTSCQPFTLGQTGCRVCMYVSNLTPRFTAGPRATQLLFLVPLATSAHTFHAWYQRGSVFKTSQPGHSLVSAVCCQSCLLTLTKLSFQIQYKINTAFKRKPQISSF